jgi:uncharacterized protein YrrD
MKFSELKGRAVINVEDATKVGEVENLLLDPGSRKVLGLKVKTSGLFSSPLIVAVPQIINIGPDAVTVKADLSSSDKAKSEKEWVELTDILGNKVVTDAGTMVGEIHDVLLDPVSAAVTGYEVREGGMFAKSLEIAATPDVRYGEKLITIPAPLPS